MRTLVVTLAAVFIAASTAYCEPAGQKSPPTYDEARQSAWMLAGELAKAIDRDDAKKWPGTQAWLKDFREQTKGIAAGAPAAKWPKVNFDALMDHNPNFWRMYYETAPGDPIITLLHASLLLCQGEAMRSAYVAELGRHRAGTPKELSKMLESLQATAMAAMRKSNGLTREGTELFDQADYDGALKKYREALALCPQNGWTSYEMGYTLRTRDEVARGETPGRQGTVRTSVKSHDSPAVTAAFAEARRHDPMQFMAYQGSDPGVIKGCLVLVKKVKPAWEKLGEKGIDRDGEYYALRDLSEGFQEAGVFDLALVARQLMVARRNGFDPADYPIIAACLTKLAPGKMTDEVLKRLRGDEAAGKYLTLRPLTKLDAVEGAPELGSPWKTYMPDTPRPKEDPNAPVKVDFLRLITNENDLANRVTIDDLVKFNKAFEAIAIDMLAKSQKPCKVLVQFTCSTKGHEIKVMHQPIDVDEKPLKELYKAVAKLEKLPVKQDTVVFQVQFTVKPQASPAK